MKRCSPVIIAASDMERLSRLIYGLKRSLFRDQQQIECLEQTLQIAELRDEDKMPRNVIRMNSSVSVLDFDTQRKQEYTLVYPERSDISHGFMSVLAPMGIALLGRQKGDTVEVKVPGGMRKLKIQRVRSSAKSHMTRMQGPARAWHILGCDDFSSA
jgi:regulator of nucleoside diphosphate kinase